MPENQVEEGSLVGLVGGQHESVIQIDRTRLYCVFNKEFRLRTNRCEHCHLPKDEPSEY
jgi:hypothetical protein